MSNLGGLGGFGAYTLSPQEIYDTHKAIQSKTDKPYNLNLWVSDHDIIDEKHTKQQYQKAVETFKPYFDLLQTDIPSTPLPFESRFQNQLEVVLDIKPKVFSFMFGLLGENLIEDLHRQGTVVLGNATTLDEAIALEKQAWMLLWLPVLKAVVTDLHSGSGRTFYYRNICFDSIN